MFIVRAYASYSYEHKQVEKLAFCETVLAVTQRMQNTFIFTDKICLLSILQCQMPKTTAKSY